MSRFVSLGTGYFPVGEGLLDFPGTAFRIRLTFPKKEMHCCRAVEDARPYGRR